MSQEDIMKHIALERKLRARVRKRRLAEGALAAVFLVILIVFAVLYEQSRTVEEIGLGFIQYPLVTYDTRFLWGILVGAVGLCLVGTWLLADLVFSRINSLTVGEDYVTFYRGTLGVDLYVNGEQRDSLMWGHYLETTLSDGTRMTVSLGKWSAHFTFSNGQPSMDIYVTDGSDYFE